MSKELTKVSLRQGELHLSMSLDKETMDKMVEIRNENPEKWEDRDLSLFNEASRQLKEERASKEK